MTTLAPLFVLTVVVAGLPAGAQSQSAALPGPAEAGRVVPQFLVNGEPKQLYLMVPTPDGSGGSLVKVTSIRYTGTGDVNLSVDPVEGENDSALPARPPSSEKAVLVPAAVSTSPFARILVNYSGTKELSCPQDHPVLVSASCDYTGLSIMWDQNSLLPPGSAPSTRWTHWLLPNAQAATGVHCAQPSALFSSQARLLCTSLH
jgi:hypothetical protein